ncbi:MAG: hypothetical protein WC309_01155 [Candidatus Paceibacterota bacterium]|jgi:hypothetical protein
MDKVKRLREKYPQFVYSNYSYNFSKNNLDIVFNFKIKPDLKFKTKITIKNVKQKRGLDNLIFHLGLIEMLNYWKATCSPEIAIEAGYLNSDGIKFLKKVIFKGMGQYFYENKINYLQNDFLKIKNDCKKKLSVNIQKNNKRRVLIPVGGGKDTPVTIELMRDDRNTLNGFILNPRKSQLNIARIGKLKNLIIVSRELDPKLLRLNKKIGLNGHVPFSAFLSCLSLIIATLTNSGRVAFSWEKSSNEPNIKYLGKWVNHQWSKSIEFEKLFNSYSKKHLAKNIEIFSPTRNFSESEIVKIFSKLEKYHQVFLSCNNAYKIGKKNNKWCGKCPKCLSVYMYLYPFLGKEKLKKIFKKDLFEDRKLIPLMKQLIGKEKFKPFECVGTIKENRKIFEMLKKQNKDKNNILLKI